MRIIWNIRSLKIWWKWSGTYLYALYCMWGRVHADSTYYYIRHERMPELNIRPFYVSAVHYLERYRNQPRSAGISSRGSAVGAVCLYTLVDRSMLGVKLNVYDMVYIIWHRVESIEKTKFSTESLFDVVVIVYGTH